VFSNEQINFKTGIPDTLGVPEAHSKKFFIFRQDDFLELMGAEHISGVTCGQYPAATLRILDPSYPMSMPSEIPHANGEANWRGLVGPILKNSVCCFCGDVAGHCSLT
jgi:hypothetical protein